MLRSLKESTEKGEKIMSKEASICMEYSCSECCNPVRIDSKRIIDPKLPFEYKGVILVPEERPDYVRLKVYSCKNFDSKTGLCIDYDSRPTICRNTLCKAFKTECKKEREDIIASIKKIKFFSLNF